MALIMNFSQKFEPAGNRVIHGAGQEFSPSSKAMNFNDYWSSVSSKPLLFMTYAELKPFSIKWFNNLKSQLDCFRNLIPQIGLSFNDECRKRTGDTSYEKEVASGLFDEQIDFFLKGVKGFKTPFFVRLGYEFNGSQWNDYSPKHFISAWQRVVSKSRSSGVDNIAWVWCMAPSGDSDYNSYYPGDDFVDWWGINIFSSSDIKKSVSNQFLRDAEKHHRPVMIGEASPVYSGTKKGSGAWVKWFKPFFQWIHDNPVIKAFCYVNVDWTRHKQFDPWLDCLLSNNESIIKSYSGELSKSLYVHNMPIKKFLSITE